MLPIKHKKIFQNRWWAVVWAGGIIWSAVEFVGDQPSGQDASDNGAATAALVNAMGERADRSYTSCQRKLASLAASQYSSPKRPQLSLG